MSEFSSKNKKRNVGVQKIAALYLVGFVLGIVVGIVYQQNVTYSVEQGLRIYYTGNVLPRTYIQTFPIADTTPDVSTGAVWRTYGVSGYTITDFDSPYGAQTLTVLGSYANERIAITLTDAEAGEIFHLTYAGADTTELAYNASTEEVDAALELLAAMTGTDDIFVSGVAGGPYTVFFQDVLAETDVGVVTGTGTGGDGLTVACVVDVVGGTANTTIVSDCATILLDGNCTMDGDATLSLIYDTKKEVWIETGRTDTTP